MTTDTDRQVLCPCGDPLDEPFDELRDEQVCSACRSEEQADREYEGDGVFAENH